MSKAVIKEARRQVREQACDLDTPEHMEFLREPAERATSEADVAGYVAEGEFGTGD